MRPKRLADDIAGTHDYNVLALNLNAFVGQKLKNAVRGAGSEQCLADNKPTDVGEVEAVHVLRGVDGLQDPPHLDVVGERQLNQDPVHALTRVQGFDLVDELVRLDGRREIEAARRRPPARRRACCCSRTPRWLDCRR